MSKKEKMKKGDILLITLIGLIGVVSLLWMFWSRSQATALTAVVNRDGKVLYEIDLNSVEETSYITIDKGLEVVLQVEKGRIHFLEADCPDKICIKAGWLTKPGDQAVCLPSKTIVRIEGNES